MNDDEGPEGFQGFAAPGLNIERVTLDKANELLDKALAEKGADYVYVKPSLNGAEFPGTECRNWWQGEPSCLIGHCLWYLGIKPNECPEGAIQNVVLDICLDIEPAALVLWREAQMYQDRGNCSWGEAVAKARLYVSVLAERGHFDDGHTGCTCHSAVESADSC